MVTACLYAKYLCVSTKQTIYIALICVAVKQKRNMKDIASDQYAYDFWTTIFMWIQIFL